MNEPASFPPGPAGSRVLSSCTLARHLKVGQVVRGWWHHLYKAYQGYVTPRTVASVTRSVWGWGLHYDVTYDDGTGHSWGPGVEVDTVPILNVNWAAVNKVPAVYTGTFPIDDKFPHRCPACGARAYVGLNQVEHESRAVTEGPACQLK